MTTNEEKNIVAKNFLDLEYPQLLKAFLEVRPQPNGRLAMDTTRIYQGLSEVDQGRHTVRIQPVDQGDRFRSARRSDVIAKFVSKTCRHIHVSVDVRTDIVTFRLNFIPKKVFEREKNQILLGLQKILVPVTTLPKIVMLD